MSWSVTLNDFKQDTVIPVEIIEDMMTQHIKYPEDMQIALDAAKRAGFKSVVMLGFRTPNPYGGDEVAEITVRGLVVATDFQAEMLRIVRAGGDVSPEAVVKKEANG